MDAGELLMPDHNPSGVYFCGKCRMTTANHAYAVRCCNERCERCGSAKHKYRAMCDACCAKAERDREAARFDKAKRLTPAEYDGPFFVPNSDRFFADLEAFEEHYHDEPEEVKPRYLWCGSPVRMTPDFEGNLRDRMHGNFHEDADDSIPKAAWDELNAFEKKWWEGNKPESWDIDYSRCVVLDLEAGP